MVTITKDNDGTKVYLDSGEAKAYEIIRDHKFLGLPPRDLIKELKNEGISSEERRAGARAFTMEKQGAEIISPNAGWNFGTPTGLR